MPKVLMLGWEFPPLFSGGLGIATFGIVKALSRKTKITLIVPSSPAAATLDNVKIIGLNRITAEEVDLEKISFPLSLPNTEVHQVEMAMSPYHHINDLLHQNQYRTADQFNNRSHGLQIINSIFSESEIYGNIMYKVQLFSALAEQIALRSDFDVIHAHDWITYPAAVNIKKQTGKPLLLHVHALETDRAGHSVRNEIYELERNALNLADSVIAVSHYTRDQLLEHYHIDPTKIHVVHNGIDPVPAVRKQHALKDKLVVFLGRLTNQKGPQFLLETAEKVLTVYPRVKFVVAGMGDQFAHLLETSAYKKIGDKFIFAGFLTKARVNELLSMADVYFMPSVSEPFGLTALEAAQYGVPGVLSAQSGAAEVLKSSLKADFWDTNKFANYIFALLKYNALHHELGKNAFQELKELTWDHTAGKIFTLYTQHVNA
jgi:glycogen(starch) synthase